MTRGTAPPAAVRGPFASRMGWILPALLLACGGDPDPDAGAAASADSMAIVADPAAANPDTIPPAAAEPGVSDPPAAPSPDPSPELDSPKISGALRMALAADPPPDSLLVLITSRPGLDSDGLTALTSAFLRVRTARGEVATAMASPAALADLIRSDRVLYIELSIPQPAAR